MKAYIDGSVKDCSISIANALEIFIGVLHFAIDIYEDFVAGSRYLGHG